MPNSRMAIITFLDGQGGTGPDNSLPGGFPGRPDNSLPGYGGRPDNSLPPGAVQLPVFPFDPTIDNSLPGSPDYPTTGPIVPGKKFVVKWLACHGLILVPDNSLPGAPVRPDNSLPSGRPDRPDQGLPSAPVRPDAGLPPTEATPKLYGG